MGVLVKYNCRHCDYYVDDLAIGPGFGGDQEAVICKDCGSVESRPLDAEKNVVAKFRKCSKCQSENLVLWDKTCPKCGSKDLEMDIYGFWS